MSSKLPNGTTGYKLTKADFQQINRRNNLEQLCRTPLRGDRDGQQDKDINFVDRIHGVSFENL